MHGVHRTLSQICRKLHKLSHDGPSDTLKRKVAELEKKKKRRIPNKNQLYVDVPESKAWLDTATMPMILTAVGTALFAKILMMVYYLIFLSLNWSIINPDQNSGHIWPKNQNLWFAMKGVYHGISEKCSLLNKQPDYQNTVS